MAKLDLVDLLTRLTLVAAGMPLIIVSQAVAHRPHKIVASAGPRALGALPTSAAANSPRAIAASRTR